MSERTPIQRELFTPEESGGAGPTRPLQPKELRLVKMTTHSWKRYIAEKHYLHCAGATATAAFLVVGPSGEVCGCLTWANPVARNQDDGETLELVRFFLEDACGRNSESRLLGVSARLIRRLFPKVRRLLAYSDPEIGHQGTIYKAAGWQSAGETQPHRAAGWDCPSRRRAARKTSMGPKLRWEKAI